MNMVFFFDILWDIYIYIIYIKLSKLGLVLEHVEKTVIFDDLDHHFPYYFIKWP